MKFIYLIMLYLANTIYGQNKPLIKITDTPKVYKTVSYKKYWIEYQKNINDLKLPPTYITNPPNVWIDNYYLLNFPGGCYSIKAKDLTSYIKNDTLYIVWNSPWWDCPKNGESSRSSVEIEINKKLYPNYKKLKEKFVSIKQKNIFNRVWKKNNINDSLDYLYFKRDTIIVFNTTCRNVKTTYKCEFKKEFIENNIKSEIINGYFELNNDTLRLPNKAKSDFYTPISIERLKNKESNLIVGYWNTGMGDGGQPYINLKNDGIFQHYIPSCTNKSYSNNGEWFIDTEYLYLFNLNEWNNLQKYRYFKKGSIVEVNTDDKTTTNHWGKIEKK